MNVGVLANNVSAIMLYLGEHSKIFFYFLIFIYLLFLFIKMSIYPYLLVIVSYAKSLSNEPAHVKRGLTELEVEFEISMDLCREKNLMNTMQKKTD